MLIYKQIGNIMSDKVGVWIIGIYGNISSLVIGGTKLLSEGISPIGILTELEDFEDLNLLPFDSIIFGGHDIRKGSISKSFDNMCNDAHIKLNDQMFNKLSEYFSDVEKNVRVGTSVGCGKIVSQFKDADENLGHLEDITNKIIKDLKEFKDKNNLKKVIVINLSSTEPPIPTGPHIQSIDEFINAIKNNRKDLIRASSIYAYASFFNRFPYINFTPSAGASIPALMKFAEIQKIPHAGNDGKTGETLVKSILALVFYYRQLKVLAWQSYNILGNLDGETLTDPETKLSKEITKDGVVPNILGYKPHTKIGIDYVPSLGDWKIAWDYIHFEGFLGTRMNMQFTWSGCDSILAAPVVIDLIRLIELAHRRGDKGALCHLALFFKQPIGTNVTNLAEQWNLLWKHLKE